MNTFTKSLTLITKCDACKSSFSYNINTMITPIINISQIIEVYINSIGAQTCEKCLGKSIQLISVQCDPHPSITDNYGDPSWGEWYCEACNPRRNSYNVFYPGRLRLVENGLTPIDRANEHRYVKILHGDTPWKCPDCNKLLTYRESRKAY